MQTDNGPGALAILPPPLYRMCSASGMNVSVCVCTCAAAPVCECVLSLTVRVMTSNTNPLDWDYSSSRAAARRPEADARDQFSLLTRHFGRTPAVFRLCDFISQALTRDIKVTHIAPFTASATGVSSLALQDLQKSFLFFWAVCLCADVLFHLLIPAPLTTWTSCYSTALCLCLFFSLQSLKSQCQRKPSDPS